ncbi:MAG: type II secretion system minor pseudopilin GspH [Gammaproteobacteria bacterium]
MNRNTCTRARYTHAGFTLIELLVAVVIIGVMMTIMVLAVGNTRADETKKATARLAAVTELARQNALFNAEDLALSFWENGYAFHRYAEVNDAKGWMLLEEDEQLRPQSLGDDVSVTLYLEGIEVELDRQPKHKPQIFILSSGETTPFEARIEDDQENVFVFSSDALGNLAVQDNREPAS